MMTLAATSAGAMGERMWTRGVTSPLAARQNDFASVLARGAEGKTAEESARAAAEEFVSITLVQPLLAGLRESNRAAPPFAPSLGERQFQSLLDAHVAQQVVRAAQFPLVDRLARQLMSVGT